jgi:putative NADH-flavin reductase
MEPEEAELLVRQKVDEGASLEAIAEELFRRGVGSIAVLRVVAKVTGARMSDVVTATRKVVPPEVAAANLAMRDAAIDAHRADGRE